MAAHLYNQNAHDILVVYLIQFSSVQFFCSPKSQQLSTQGALYCKLKILQQYRETIQYREIPNNQTTP